MPQASAASRRARSAAVLVVVMLAATSAPPANADKIGTAQERANILRAQLDSLQAQAAITVAEYETVHEDLERAVGEAISAEISLRDAQSSNANAQDLASDRVRAIYKSGGRTAMYAAVLKAANPHEVLARVANISAVVEVDTVSVDRATFSQRRAQVAVGTFEKATLQRQELERVADEKTTQIEELMAAQEQAVAGADAEVQALIEEQRRVAAAARQAAAAAESARLAALAQEVSVGDLATAYQPAGGTYACPTGLHANFIDSWHFARSGGRLHQGTDMFAPEGAGAYAVTDGVVDKWGNGGLGGISLWIRAGNGDRYYYAHNSVNIAAVGSQVRAGELVALVGQTGNAAGTPPHVHFEAHPGGAGAANPYPFLAAICGIR
ncbi:MAG: peptidoglycan DD-metalloendopeptidase family protein [Mycobacteriales bacterium]